MSTMLCAFCGSENVAGDHRCGRCARRLNTGVAPVVPAARRAAVEDLSARRALTEEMVQQTLGLHAGGLRASQPSATSAGPRSTHLFEATALARKPELVPDPEPNGPREPVQGVLFTAHEARRGEKFTSKVVALEDFRQSAPKPRRRSAPRTRPAGRALPPQEVELQGNLFSEPIEAPLVSSAALAQPTLRPDAVVAPRVHRATAVVLDFAMVALAFGLMLAGIYYSPLGAYLNPETLPVMAGILVLMTIGYKLLFAFAETDSPGIRWAGLKMLNFDGHPARRNERLARIAGGLLSLAAAGLGLLWALVDEESLGWPDHISKTYATPNFQPKR